MNLTLYHHLNAEAFLSVALEPLEAAESANNLILGVPLSLRLHPERAVADAYFTTLHANGALVAAALRTPPHHLVVHVEDSARDQGDSIIARLVDDTQAHAGALNGVNGRVPWSQRFAQAWSQRTGVPTRLGTRLRAFALHAVVAPPPVAGALRKAGAADEATIVAMIQAFWDEVMGSDPGRPDTESIRRKLEAGEIYLWEVEGVAVSLVAKSRPMPHGVTLGPVYTPPAQRGKGYAANCTAAVSQLLLDAGWDYCALFTDLENPISNRVYEKIGYEAVCDYADYHFAQPR